MAVTRLALIKFLELLLCCACIGLHYKSFGGLSTEIMMLVTGTFCGYFVILVGDSAGQLSSAAGRRLDVFYSLLGAILFIASGAFCIKEADHAGSFINRDAEKYAMAKGIIAVINGALFLFDSLFTWRGEH